MDDNPTGFHESIPLKTLRHQTSYENMNVSWFVQTTQWTTNTMNFKEKLPEQDLLQFQVNQATIDRTRKKVKSANEAAKESAAESCDGGYHKDAFSNVFQGPRFWWIFIRFGCFCCRFVACPRNTFFPEFLSRVSR
ncbi:hypothetical protein OS493_027011 [Desmophyllum pertusum]|uniref:Uncharacterized protein n=1 Tax=Desmophyllum pertusum TaxID=174260 RepID=A0A9W9YKZ5_9CNID|nr:hypothetical protein OS493_027011 [Desmophyllum pertusum]